MQEQTIPQIATAIRVWIVRSGDACAHMAAGVHTPGRSSGQRVR